jgi:hypothetical protein
MVMLLRAYYYSIICVLGNFFLKLLRSSDELTWLFARDLIAINHLHAVDKYRKIAGGMMRDLPAGRSLSR